MCAIKNCKDHTPEERKVVEDFNKLIFSKLQDPPCIVYDPPPTSCNHSECHDPPTQEAVAAMMANPKGFLAGFSKEELDVIVEMGKDVPEICGNGE